MMKTLEEVISGLRKVDSPVRVVCEESADGLAAGYLLGMLLTGLGKKFVVAYEDKKQLKNVLKEKYDWFIFVFNEELNEDARLVRLGVKHGEINAGVLGINGESLSEVVYGFCARIMDFKKHGWVVVANALPGIKGYASSVLKECMGEGMINAVNGLRMFNNAKRELVKEIAYSYDPCLRSVYGDENKARAFLENIKISGLEGGKGIIDLSGEEVERLVSAVLLDMVGIEEGDAFGMIYTANDCDLLWVKLVVEVCLKQNKHGVAYGFLKGSREDVKQAVEMYDEHAMEMIKALKKINGSRIEKNYGCFNLGGEFKYGIYDELVRLVVKRKILKLPLVMIIAYAITNEVLAYGRVDKEHMGRLVEELGESGWVKIDEEGFFNGEIKNEEGLLKKIEGWFSS